MMLLVGVLGGAAAVVAVRSQPAMEPERSSGEIAAAAAGLQPAAKAPTAPTGVRRHGVAEPKARPSPKGATMRLASYNIENLFDDKDDPALSGRHEDAQMTKPVSHRKAAAEAIRRIDADVLALQEIESREALLWFRDEFLSDMGYEHVVSLDAGDERGIEQAVLSRFPVKDVKQWVGQELGGTHPEKFGREANHYAGQPIRFHRSPLRVTIEAPGAGAPGSAAKYELTLFVVHLKSGGPGGYWREREAQGIAREVLALQKENPKANVVVLGDFNAQLSEASMKTLTVAPDGPRLKDAFDDRPARDTTIQTHSSGRVIDHMLFSSEGWKEVVLETRFVLGTMTRPEGVDWRNTPAPEGWAADHYPVVVDIRLQDVP